VINVEKLAAALAQTPLKLVIHADRLRQSNTRRQKLGSCLLFYGCIYFGYPLIMEMNGWQSIKEIII